MTKLPKVSLPEEYVLIALDVESLYTNLDHANGLQAVREVMTQCPLFDSIIDLLNFVLILICINSVDLFILI